MDSDHRIYFTVQINIDCTIHAHGDSTELINTICSRTHSEAEVITAVDGGSEDARRCIHRILNIQLRHFIRNRRLIGIIRRVSLDVK